LKLVALLPVNQSSKQAMYCDKGKDDEILSKLHNSPNTQPDWHGPNLIGMGQNKRSLKASARIPFTTFRSNLSSGLTRWVHSHAVKVPVTSTTKVSFSNNADAKTNNAKVSFSNNVDAKTNNAKVSFSNNADAKTNNALSFRHMASSTLQLVVASVNNKFSKGPTKTKNALPFGGKQNKSINGKSASRTFQLVVA
jgi:hypothetical protein